MDLRKGLALLDRLASLYMASTESDVSRRWRVDIAESALHCDDCRGEPFAVMWGKIRVGYDLDGYYSQLMWDGTVRLLCRRCWHAAIGVDDPLRPNPATSHNHA